MGQFRHELKVVFIGRIFSMETVDERYWRLRTEYFKIIHYCNGTLNEKNYVIDFLRSEYGEPTPELKQMAKNKLEELLHEYLQTL